MAQPTLGQLQMEANAVVSDLFIGRPGMESTIRDINTTQGHAGNLKIAINDTVESIMANSANGPEAVQEAIAEFKEAADAAADIYDNVHDVALEAFQEHPELMAELKYMVDSSLPESEMTSDHMADEIAGDIASQIWNTGNYVTIEDIKEALQNSDALDSNIQNAQQAAEAFINHAQNYQPEHENTAQADAQNEAAMSKQDIAPDGKESTIKVQGNGDLAAQAAKDAGSPQAMIKRVDPDEGTTPEAPRTAAEHINKANTDNATQPDRQEPDAARDMDPGLGLG